MSHPESVSHQWILFCFLSLLNQCVFVLSRNFAATGHQPVRHPSISRVWSDWTPWSACSRTCGGGVRQRTRTCIVKLVGFRTWTNTCSGETIEYELCSRHPCSLHGEDFLTYQCSKRNGQVINGRKIDEWVPFRNGRNPCELQCWAKDRSLVYGFGKVVDGTPCPAIDPRDPALCVNGRCTPVDCAGQFGTDNRRDICGICRGENATCVKHQSTFWRRPRIKLDGNGVKDRHYDYNEIFSIPAGATHIKVKEESQTNFLVLGDHKGHNFINGNWRVQSPGRFTVHGSEFIYNRTLGGFEELSSTGPTRSVLNVLVLGSGDIPTVHYEYWISTIKPLSQRPVLSFQTPETIPQKHPFDSELRPLNNDIDTSHSQTKSLPTKLQQGYKSYYHRNEILKSVPSWSVKRHRTHKHPINRSFADQQNGIQPEQWRNRTIGHVEDLRWNRTVGHVEDLRWNRTVGHVEDLRWNRTIGHVADLRWNPTSHNVASTTTVSSGNLSRPRAFDRPDATAAFTRTNHVFLKAEDEELALRSTHSSRRKDDGEGRRAKKKQKSREKGDDRMRLKRKRKSGNGCPICPRVKQQIRNFCVSDFVLHTVVLASEEIHQSIRLELEVTRSFKNKVPILSREYVWIPDTCQCPRLRVGKEYILMGHSSTLGGTRESKLIVDRNSFVRQYTQKRAKTMLRLVRDQNAVCKRFKT